MYLVTINSQILCHTGQFSFLQHQVGLPITNRSAWKYAFYIDLERPEGNQNILQAFKHCQFLPFIYYWTYNFRLVIICNFLKSVNFCLFY